MIGHNESYDYIIVGSGTGGSTIARELSKKTGKILVLEMGKLEKSYGTFKDALRFFDHKKNRMPIRSKEGVIIWRSIMAGGSGFVAMGNFTRCLEDEFKEIGIDLSEELLEAESDIRVKPLPERFLSSGGRTIKQAAEELGYEMEMMPKGIDPSKCIKCGNCSFGCTTGAKWTPLNYLNEAIENGVEVWYNTGVKHIIVENDEAIGVVVEKNGQNVVVKGKKIILSAGAIGTPQLLLECGVKEAGTNFFIDPLVMVYGVHESANLMREPQMSLLYSGSHEEGFILSSNVNHPRMLRYFDSGMKGFMLKDDSLLGIMVKIKDDPSGNIDKKGVISKKMTKSDLEKISKGANIAKKILEKAGSDPKKIIVTKPSGAHIGGTAAVGKVVDLNFQTKIKNLYVCDASALPTSPGMPPMLTIIAMAKNLAKKI